MVHYYSGLIRLSNHRCCSGIGSRLIPEFMDRVACRWVFHGHGLQVISIERLCRLWQRRPFQHISFGPRAVLRVDETRAVNRALRKAYGIGLCPVEELGSFSSSS